MFKGKGKLKVLLQKELALVLFGTGVTVILSFLLIKVLTKILLPGQYGFFSLLNTFILLCSTVFFGGLINGISRFYTRALNLDSEKYYLAASRNLIYSVIKYLLVLVVILFVIFLITCNLKFAAITFILFFQSILYSLMMLLSSIENVRRRRLKAQFVTSIDSFIKIFLIFVLNSYGFISVMSILVVYTISSGILFFYLFAPYRQIMTNKVQGSVKVEFWKKKIWTVSYPFYITNLFGWMQQSSSRWALDLFNSKEEVGYFSILFQIGFTPLQMLLTILLTYVTPLFFDMITNERIEFQKRKLSNSIISLVFGVGILTIVAGILSFLYHADIVMFFSSESYLEYSIYLGVMVFSAGLFSIAQIYLLGVQALNKMHDLIAGGIFISILGTMYSFIFVYFFGVIGAVFSSLLFSITYLVFMKYKTLKI